MYIKEDKQLSLFAFGQSAGMELDPKNRWVRMAEKVDWDKIEEKYCGMYCSDNGASAKPMFTIFYNRFN